MKKLGEYLTIYFGTTSAAPKAVEWDRAMLVGDGSPSTLTESKTYELSAEDWQSQLEDDGFAASDQVYKSTATFFSADPVPDKLWLYAHISGACTDYTNVPLTYVGGYTWEIPLKPPESFVGAERVKFYCCTGDKTIGTFNNADGTAGIGFTVEKDGAGNWTGQLTFDNGLSGTQCGWVKKDDLEPYCKITCDFRVCSRASISEAINNYKINLISLALDVEQDEKNHSYNLFGSQIADLMTILNAISGKRCIFFYALPGDANPDDAITGGGGLNWVDLKSLVGARSDFAALKCKPSTLEPDPAVGYMAMTSISHPHLTLTFAQPHFGVHEQEPAINRSKWKDAQIACFMKRTELSGDPFLITYGYTFGSGDAARVNGQRCRNIIAQTLINNIWALLAKRTTLCSYAGCQSLKDVIKGTFKTLVDQGIVDKFKTVNIPIENDFKDNTAAGRIARAQHIIPAVEVEYYWYPTVEKIIITRVSNEAT